MSRNKSKKNSFLKSDDTKCNVCRIKNDTTFLFQNQSNRL